MIENYIPSIKFGSNSRDFEITEIDLASSAGWRDYIDYGGIAIGSDHSANRQMIMFTDGGDSDNILTVATTQNDGSTWEADFVIQQNGNVGIGTSNPASRLEVAGEVRVTTSAGSAGKFRIDNAGSNAPAVIAEVKKPPTTCRSRPLLNVCKY